MDATMADCRLWQRSKMEPMTTISEAREQLRVAMACWPHVDDRTRAFLDSLHWRRRRVAVLAYGERLTIRDIAARVVRSEPTVQRDLQVVCRAYRRFLQRS